MSDGIRVFALKHSVLCCLLGNAAESRAFNTIVKRSPLNVSSVNCVLMKSDQISLGNFNHYRLLVQFTFRHCLFHGINMLLRIWWQETECCFLCWLLFTLVSSMQAFALHAHSVIVCQYYLNSVNPVCYLQWCVCNILFTFLCYYWLFHLLLMT